MAGMFDYYDVLGLDESASQDEIQHAYRLTIKQFHPDINTAPNASRMCEMLNEAYAVLKDPQKRSQYDLQFGRPRERLAEGEASEVLLQTCDRCRQTAVHLRIVEFYRVKSYVLYCRGYPIEGIFCQKCRSTLAWQTASTSLFLGAWSFLSSDKCIKAMYFACIGGRTRREETAELLRSQSACYLRLGELDAAFTTLSYSLEYEEEENEEAYEQLQSPLFATATLLPDTSLLPGQCVAISYIFAIVAILYLCFFHPLQVRGATMSIFQPFVLKQRPPLPTGIQVADNVQEPPRQDILMHSDDQGYHWEPIPFGNASLYKIIATKKGIVHVLNYDGKSEFLKLLQLVSHGLNKSVKNGTWFYLHTTDQGQTQIKIHAMFKDHHKAAPILRSRNGGKTWEFIPVNTGSLYKILGVNHGFVKMSTYNGGNVFDFMRNEIEMHGIDAEHEIGSWYYIGIDAGGRAEIRTETEYLEIQSQCESHICTD